MNYSDSSSQDTSFSRDYQVKCCLKLRMPKYVITSPHDKVLQREFNYSDKVRIFIDRCHRQRYWTPGRENEPVLILWALLSVLSSFLRIMPPSFFLQLWRVAMTARTLRGYCTTWGLKSWYVWLQTYHHTVLSERYLTINILAGGSDQKGLHAGWDRGGGAARGWGWRGGALCVSTQCWS